MSDSGRRMSRRELLQSGATWTAAGLFGLSRRAAASERSSRVVLIRHRDVIGAGRHPDEQILHRMLNESVIRLLDAENPGAAWRQLISPGDVVGIKSNVWRQLPTPPELERAIVEEVVAAGVSTQDVSVDDRGVLSNAVFERALARPNGALINVRPMRTHHWSGLGTCLKNMIMFVPRPADYHDDACARLGELWKELGLAEKTRLNILVMLTPQFHGVGPQSFSPRFVWPYRGLIVGTDPVAVDATGARIIEAKRREFFGEERPIKPPPHHIGLADTRYGLGVADPARIEIVRLGWREEELI